jgi:hypothetical protein
MKITTYFLLFPDPETTTPIHAMVYIYEKHECVASVNYTYALKLRRHERSKLN